MGEVGLEPTKAFASGFTVRPLCHSGHSPIGSASGRTSGRRNRRRPPDGASLGPSYGHAPNRCQRGAERQLSATITDPISQTMAHPSKTRSSPDNRHGRRFPPRSKAERQPDRLWLYGIHPVAAALGNPRRTVLRLLATDNARQRLEDVRHSHTFEATTPRELSRLLGAEAVHQGVAAEVEPLPALTLDALPAEARLLLFLDQITDPHNVGAILRSAAAMAADAVIVTARYSPAETGVLAKAASGALDLLPMIAVTNLSRALEEVSDAGFFRVGLDFERARDPRRRAGAGSAGAGARCGGQRPAAEDAADLRPGRAARSAGRSAQPQRLQRGGAGALFGAPQPEGGGANLTGLLARSSPSPLGPA